MDNRKPLVLIVAVVAVLVTTLAFLGWSFFRPPEEASGPIEAEPVSVAQPAAVEDQTAVVEDPPAAVEDAPAAATAAADDAAAPVAGPTIFEILPGESVARFEIDEVLRGAPKTVVGTTDQVSGQIAVSPDDPSSSQVGTILVNARTLATDSDFRDRAIKNHILMTDAHEYVTFVPTEVVGMSATPGLGDSVEFQIVGDLTIAGVTRPATFDVSVTVVDETRIEGLASMTLRYADYGLTIPASRSVDAVEDDLILALDFVAAAQS